MGVNMWKMKNERPKLMKRDYIEQSNGDKNGVKMGEPLKTPCGSNN